MLTAAMGWSRTASAHLAPFSARRETGCRPEERPPELEIIFVEFARRGLALGGEAAARLAQVLGMGAAVRQSADWLSRTVRAWRLVRDRAKSCCSSDSNLVDPTPCVAKR